MVAVIGMREAHSRRERLGVAALGLGVFAAYAWSGRYWIDVVDEGYFLDLANRVLHGALPYRDFATYYTPGVFYLFAAVFKVFGASILPIRVLMAGLRALCAVLLYRLTRRVAPWWLAWLPVALLSAIDHWPIESEPHPSWPAVVATLLTLELVARHRASGRLEWLGVAGVAAGLTFAFKQNLGAFTALGLAAYVVLRPRVCIGRVMVALRFIFAIGVGLAVTVFLLPGLDVSVVLGLLLPCLVALALAMRSRSTTDAPGASARMAAVAGESLAAGGAWLAVTVWLGPLALALGPGQTPFGLFVGVAVDQSALAIPFAAIWPGARPPLTTDALLGPWLDALDGAFGTWHLYLPALGVWAGIGVLLTSRPSGPLVWYVLFGTLTALNMYPRADTLHAVVSSPPALVAGAGALAAVASRIRRWFAVAFGAALALVIAAAAPQVLWRYTTLVTAGSYAPLGEMLVPEQVARDTQGVVDFVQAGTPPGEPLFVYPAAPLLNFLAERPNPTRFDHFLPGTLRPTDLQLAIQDLQRMRPRYVIWDHRGVIVWQTDPANRPLSDYVWRCYRQVTAFGLYLVLERDSVAC